MGLNPFDPALADARVLGEDGKQKFSTSLAKVTRGYYYATPTNGFGTLIRRVYRALLDNPMYDGIYWDEFGFGTRSISTASPDWDGHSVIIDPQDNHVVRKVTNFALHYAAHAGSVGGQLDQLKRPLWTNWEPTTEHDTALNVPHFPGVCAPDEAARGHWRRPWAAAGIRPAIRPT